MKKLLFVLFVALLILGCSKEKPVQKTVVGVFTPYFFFPETLNGKVKEMKEVNYWPVEKEGKIDAGAPITNAERDSINWTSDFTVQFDASGLPEKVDYQDENGKTYQTVAITIVSGVPQSAERLVNDSVAMVVKISKLNNMQSQYEFVNPEADTMTGKMVVQYDENHNYQSLQWYNSKGEPTTKNEYSYAPNGKLTGFTTSRKDTVRSGMNFTYNDKGFYKTQEVYSKISGKSDSFDYEYEYDEAGNWVKTIASENGKPSVVCIRKYTYYKE